MTTTRGWNQLQRVSVDTVMAELTTSVTWCMQVTLPFGVTAEGAAATANGAQDSLVLRLPFRPFKSLYAEVSIRRGHASAAT